MKRIVGFLLMVILCMTLMACSASTEEVEEEARAPLASASAEYLTLEEAIEYTTTNVVRAIFIREETDVYMTTLEFEVIENILGKTDQVIYVRVFTDLEITTESRDGREISFGTDVPEFVVGNEYLLPLNRINNPYSPLEG